MHVYPSQHSVNIENTEILTTKSRWFEKRSKGGHKHQTVKAMNPSLNRDSDVQFTTSMGLYHRSESEGRLTEEGGGGTLCHHLMQRPKQHPQNDRTDEADRSR